MREYGEIDGVTVRVYQLRVTHPTDLVSELAERAGLSTEEVSAAEARLSEMGLIQRSPGGGWVAVSPEAAADTLLAPMEQEILRRRIAMAATRERLQALSGDYLEARSLRSAASGIEVVEGAKEIRATVDDLLASCTESIDVLHTRGGHGEDSAHTTTLNGLAVLRRGVRVRSLFLHGLRKHAATVQYAQRIAAAGAEVRSTSALPSRMLLFDDTCAVLPVDLPADAPADQPADGGRGAQPASAAVIRDPAVLGFLGQLFAHYWAESADFWEPTSDSGPEPTGMERDVLLLLSAGRSNEAIAEQLGISRRSVSRQVSCLMERLGAANRFQAGVRAARNGWLS